MNVLQVVGYKNTGKTTLVCQLVEQLRAEGYRVGTIKHDAHDFVLDQEGRDTWKMREAGSSMTAIVSGTRTAWMAERPLSLNELLAQMKDMDIVLVEGFKQETYPKVVMVKGESDQTLARQLDSVIAVMDWRLPMSDRTKTDAIFLKTEKNGEIPIYPIEDTGSLLKRIMDARCPTSKGGI